MELKYNLSFSSTVKEERSSAIPPILKLCTALRFLAEGSYQKCSGNDFNLGLAQPTVSVVLKEVLDVVEERICPQWIKARMTNDEMNLSKIHFYQKTRFPGVIGCIDGTHVQIIAPKKNLQHLYLNRKGYYSLNVMIVCDFKMNVRFVDSRYSSANHDSFVYNLSEYKEMLNELDENTFILGDPGYPLEKHLMTPF
ncbi:putative nuclease HARBI1 [Eupeodes corollae]|uniref:putative nuclease HARBI1 n=1 Tax=Eupeodes corollae TaxID=290404 RepID=UPI0024926C6F|nr:putative nuclease HARBI1 [Eupeodes corollae]